MDEIKSQDPGADMVQEIKKDGLHWRIPKSTDGGYLDRLERSLELKEEFNEIIERDGGLGGSGDELSPQALVALIKFLSVYVVTPEGDQETKVQALKRYASEDDVALMMEWSFPELFKDQEDPAGQDPIPVEVDLPPGS